MKTEGRSCPPPISGTEYIKLGHGSGGRMTTNLIENIFLPRLNNEILSSLEDASTFTASGTLAFTTDAFVVKPIFFPGGDIGKLAVNGTVNDLAMRGAVPLYLSASFILEEGFAFAELAKVIDSFQTACDLANIQLIAADTKVVNKGACDKIFISCSGIGMVPPNVDISCHKTQVGDVVIVSGEIGMHGIAVMMARENLDIELSVETDSAPLNKLVQKLIALDANIHTLRDITRGGLAGVLNEIAEASNVAIEIEEKKIPIHQEVKAACELLGLDPLYVACEGRMTITAPVDSAEMIINLLRQDELGAKAQIIGKVTDSKPGRVSLKTMIGGNRIVDLLSGEQLPRIC